MLCYAQYVAYESGQLVKMHTVLFSILASQLVCK